MEDKQHYVINGGVRVTELEPKLNFPFPTGDYVTLGGLINHRLGRIASVNDEVQLEGAKLTVLEKDRHQITKVLFEETPEFNEEDEEETELVTVEDKPKRNLLGWVAKRALRKEEEQVEPPALSDPNKTEGDAAEVKAVDFTRKTGS